MLVHFKSSGEFSGGKLLTPAELELMSVFLPAFGEVANRAGLTSESELQIAKATTISQICWWENPISNIPACFQLLCAISEIVARRATSGDCIFSNRIRDIKIQSSTDLCLAHYVDMVLIRLGYNFDFRVLGDCIMAKKWFSVRIF